MSTTATQPPGHLDLSGTRPIGFGRVVAVELRKSVDTRAGFWLLAATGLLTAAVMAIVLVVTAAQDVSMRLGDFIATTGYSSGLLLPVLGILLLTSEWSQRTAMVTFTLDPRRPLVIAAKLVAGLLLALVVALFAVVLAVLANLVYGAFQGSTDWEFGMVYFLGFLATQLFAMLSGFALAALLLNTPAAVVVYFVYAFVLPTVFAVAASLMEWFAKIQPWIDFGAAQTPLASGAMDSDAWAHLVVSGFIWLVVPLALGLWRVLRAEVK